MTCTALGCGKTGSVRGTYHCHDETFENVVYCTGCAALLMEYGEFTPEEQEGKADAEAAVERVRALAARINHKGFIFNGEIMHDLITRALENKL